MKREEGKSKVPLLVKHQNLTNIYTFQENRDVSLNVITMAANNQGKQLIRVTIVLEGKGYLSQDLAPNL